MLLGGRASFRDWFVVIDMGHTPTKPQPKLEFKLQLAIGHMATGPDKSTLEP